MNIAYTYLNKQQATIAAIRDHETMWYIIGHTNTEIKAVKDAMETLSAVSYDSQPGISNLRSGENQILGRLGEINVLEERLRQATEFVTWFQPAWDRLSEEERFILSAFFKEPMSGSPVAAVCEELHLEKSRVYQKREAALAHLTTLLYGRM